MRTDSTNIGDTVKTLRTARNISRAEMSEMVGISVSHLEKIEAGYRRPGMGTYQKILEVLDTEVVMRNEMETIQEKCMKRAQKILMDCTERQALFLVGVLEFMAQTIDGVEKG